MSELDNHQTNLRMNRCTTGITAALRDAHRQIVAVPGNRGAVPVQHVAVGPIAVGANCRGFIGSLAAGLYRQPIQHGVTLTRSITPILLGKSNLNSPAL